MGNTRCGAGSAVQFHFLGGVHLVDLVGVGVNGAVELAGSEERAEVLILESWPTHDICSGNVWWWCSGSSDMLE